MSCPDKPRGFECILCNNVVWEINYLIYTVITVLCGTWVGYGWNDDWEMEWSVYIKICTENRRLYVTETKNILELYFNSLWIKKNVGK